MNQSNKQKRPSPDRPSWVRKPKGEGWRKMREVPISELHRLFTYDSSTGVLRNGGGNAGKRHVRGYIQIYAGGAIWIAHRVAWAMHHGSWPPDQIDHINGVRDDNRICNLRLATARENCTNRAQPLSPTSGVRGVSWAKSCGKWLAQIKRNYKSYNLGYYDAIEEASAAYQKAAMEMHGEFSILHREGGKGGIGGEFHCN